MAKNKKHKQRKSATKPIKNNQASNEQEIQHNDEVDEAKSTKEKTPEPKPYNLTASALTVTNLYEDFVTQISRDNIFFKINYQKMQYSYEYQCYTPIHSKLDLYPHILHVIPTKYKDKPLDNIIKKCADMFWREWTNSPTYFSCEYYNKLALNNIFLDTNTLLPIDIRNLPAEEYDVTQFLNTYRLNITFPEPRQVGYQNITQWPTPVWDNFLNIITGNNPSLANRINEMLGYLLMPLNPAKVFFILYGLPASGKDVMVQVIQWFFYSQNTSTLTIEQIGNRYSLIGLQNKLLNISHISTNRSLSDNSITNLNNLTQLNHLTFETKTHKLVPYLNNCKFVFIAEQHIKLKAPDHTLESSIISIPFQHEITIDKLPQNLFQELHNKRHFIALKAILIHYRSLRERNFIFSGAEAAEAQAPIIYTQAPNNTIDENKFIREFVSSMCYIDSTSNYRTQTSVLHQHYLQFCTEKGYAPHSTNSSKSFAQRLSREFRGYIQPQRWRDPQTRENLRGYAGIALKAIVFNDEPITQIPMTFDK